MTQHEQKPESPEFRTRAEQIVMIMRETRYSDIIREKGLEELFDTILAEAEARGAAEQRRKDAEGTKPVGCVTRRQADGAPMFDGVYIADPPAFGAVVYNCSANVAALEARVKELEGENKAWSGAAANALTWLENGRQANARDELRAAQRRVAAIREGG